MIRVGLTGGIGAGKSTVARTFTERGAYLIDADVIAREVVAKGSDGLAALVEAFGGDILTADGDLDRPALAAKAFVDEDQRKRLNAIVHPLVGARTWEMLQAAPDDAVVVQDVPLLVEGSMAPFFHLVVIVHADEDLRVQRLTELRGMDADDARARIRSQASVDQRREVADVWLDNSSTAAALADAAARLWDERLVPYEANVRSRTRAARGSVALMSADPTWARQGRRLVHRLQAVCGDKAIRVEHIGSTAVPDLDAKDVIDLQVTVAGVEGIAALADLLADGGFPHVEGIGADRPKPGADDPQDWVKALHVAADPGRHANVHVRVEGSANARFAVAFRDRLIADADLRAEYLSVKRSAEASARGDATAYVEAKEPWFDEVYPRVMSDAGAPD
ncbi:dephospho-CoA kinase [Williamsia herbipolensis]|uniref:Dephospho-CoA kinase n=1 Tax=Williamsia herbipolensis TaxID=1603258 RepID=A0AAU4K4M0_9NOCA|nr:dephospho-CoA kinase [Williamsia herbipolensis]